MRYIGNKTRLLPFIRRVLRDRGISGGRAVDPFSGTASVATELKRLGFGVMAGDIMAYGYVFARAYVEVASSPDVTEATDGLGLRDRTLRGLAAWLDRLPATPGFVHEHYTPAGAEGGKHGRMYFTPENGARIDAIRTALEDLRIQGLDDDAYHLLLAGLIEAADRVANTTGVYAAFVKSWQPNATRPLRLRVPRLVLGNGCHAFRSDAESLVSEMEAFELLYLDPPYNTRQYPGYYHVPELLATGWFDGEVRTRGKTGLIEDADRRSDWSRAKKCEAAFERLVATARWKHLVMSYNAEGIIPESTIERVLREHGRRDTYRRYRRGYRRYRADSDARRTYASNRVDEYLYCVSR